MGYVLVMKIAIQFKELHKSFGSLDIFDNAGLTISEDQKVGVIGRNGAGKSTLLKMILGKETPDSGKIILNSSLKYAYLEQETNFQEEETVLSFLVRHTQKPEWECAEKAARFQFKGERLNSIPVRSLPGGLQTRVKLAALLLSDPDFLLIDEPTNYLDLQTLLIVERLLQDFRGGFLLVSHDREFLKRTCEQTLEVERGQCVFFPGKLEDYLEYKIQVEAHRDSHNKSIKAQQENLERFITRFRAKASKASQAASKAKQLARLQTIEVLNPLKTVKIFIPDLESKKGTALDCEDLRVGYPEKTIAEHIDFVVDRGAKVAVLGENGQGKTTFLKTLAGALSPLGGTFKWGYGLEVASYAQHVYSALPSKLTVFEYLRREAAPVISTQQILDCAGSFLFGGKDVEKQIQLLSGGERARLCLAGMLLSRKPVLLMDEPTNHLDFETVEALADALKDFKGTVFFVSHDRTFVNSVATQILNVGAGKIEKYPGTYQEYVERLKEGGDEGEPRERLSSNEKSKELSEGRVLQLQQKERQAEHNRLKSRLKKAENALDRLSQEKAVLEKDLILSYSSEKARRLQDIGALMAEEEALWLEIQEQLETVGS